MKKKFIIIVGIVLIIISIVFISYYFIVKLPKIKEKEELEKKYKELYLAELIKYDNENKLYKEYEVDIAFLGDSLTAGYDVKNYYPEYLVTNRGIGGETTYGLVDRLAVSVLELKPKVCVLLIGGNNPNTMFEDYEDILITFKEQMPETKIVIISHAPTSGEYWGTKNELFAYNNVKIKLLAEKYGYEYVDIYSPMLDLETGKMNEKYTVDGAHFTSEGYIVVTNTIKPVIDKIFEEYNK